ncbi:MAG: FtsW/RodA/SpoVE family cell cycle protein [Dysgonamonadaceae bacterium]|jgi:cell division protein FtsW|nr:FtsW/RodA/SpoVE family cell cycle protein [Dysgonamonadaceae bacterium]
MDFVNKIFRGDRVIWMVFLFLCLISIVEVYSASSTLTFRTDYWKPILRHSLFLLGGLVVVLFVHAIPARFFSILGILLPVAWVFLVGARLFGDPVNGSYRFVSVGGISFQPSEIAKICLISLTAFILSKNKENDKRYKWILIAAMITCGIIMIENGSTAILLFLVIYLMLFIGQIPLKKIGLLTLAILFAGALFVASLFVVPDEMKDKYVPRALTWKNRMLDFFVEKPDVYSPDFTINDDNYQVSHAHIAIANGRIGKLPGNSVERDFLPQAYSEFIYAIIIEEMGLIGGFFVLLLYIILFIRAGIIANRSEKLFSKLMVMGAALILVTQALANMAVAVGLIPVTGQTLPLISRGGTSILITCIYFGIILSVSRFDNPKGEKREEAIIEAYTQDEETAENNH